MNNKLDIWVYIKHVDVCYHCGKRRRLWVVINDVAFKGRCDSCHKMIFHAMRKTK